MGSKRSESFEPAREPTMAERLLSPERERWADSGAVISLLCIAADAAIADIGCGPGYFTVRLARAAANGWIHALDIDTEMLDRCRETVAQAGLANVTVRGCDDYEFGLDEGSLDLIFLSCVVHHADDQVRFLAAARRLLRSSGRCGILEWVDRESDFGPPRERRIGRDRLLARAEAAGFRDPACHQLSEHQYLVIAAPGDRAGRP